MFVFQFEHSLLLEVPAAPRAELDVGGLLHELWYKFTVLVSPLTQKKFMLRGQDSQQH